VLSLQCREISAKAVTEALAWRFDRPLERVSLVLVVAVVVAAARRMT